MLTKHQEVRKNNLIQRISLAVHMENANVTKEKSKHSNLIVCFSKFLNMYMDS